MSALLFSGCPRSVFAAGVIYVSRRHVLLKHAQGGGFFFYQLSVGGTVAEAGVAHAGHVVENEIVALQRYVFSFAFLARLRGKQAHEMQLVGGLGEPDQQLRYAVAFARTANGLARFQRKAARELHPHQSVD